MLLGHSGVVGLFHVHERASIDHVCNLVYTFSFTHNKSVQLVVENLFGGTTTEYNSIAKRAIIYAVEDIIIICFVICLLGWNQVDRKGEVFRGNGILVDIFIQYYLLYCI